MNGELVENPKAEQYYNGDGKVMRISSIAEFFE